MRRKVLIAATIILTAAYTLHLLLSTFVGQGEDKGGMTTLTGYDVYREGVLVETDLERADMTLGPDPGAVWEFTTDLGQVGEDYQDPAIILRSYSASLIVYLDGDQIYTLDSSGSYQPQSFMGGRYNIFSLPDGWHECQLRIVYRTDDVTGRYGFYSPIIGERSTLVQKVVGANLPSLIIGLAIIASSFLILCLVVLMDSTRSRVNLLSPSGEKGATGYSPRIRPFEVVGIFKTGMFEYDATLAFVDLKAARDILGLPDGFLTGIEIMVDDVYKADAIAQSVQDTLGSPFYVRHWMEMNANLFAALKLEKIGMFILLTMVVLIGSFSIVTSLVMLVMEKTRDIAILMSMGATRSMIRRIFMLQGTIIGFVGTLLGYGMGLSLGWALKRYRFIKLPENVYTLDHLPIIITWQDVLIIGASAMLLCFLATLYPARQAARLEPAEALRYE